MKKAPNGAKEIYACHQYACVYVKKLDSSRMIMAELFVEDNEVSLAFSSMDSEMIISKSS